MTCRLDGRIAVVLGTRPEIIKMAQVIAILGDRAAIIHTGQHWDRSMSGQFLGGMGLPRPCLQFDFGGSSRGDQIADVLRALNLVFSEDPPDAVVVQGDTNSVLAGALAANANGAYLVHVEAGLRSHDRAMPEEHNRVVTDHLADLCLSPTDTSRANLLSEGIPEERVVVTGNTVVGAISNVLRDRSISPPDLPAGIAEGDYAVATIHRPENTDDAIVLSTILSALGELEHPVVFPIHPRTQAAVDRFGLGELLASIAVVDPLSYEAFIHLAAGAAFTISDSGGVQEEASVWKRPVLVVRRSTERPEVQGTFAELVRPDDLAERARRTYAERATIFARLQDLPSPYGDEFAAQRTVDAIDSRLLLSR